MSSLQRDDAARAWVRDYLSQVLPEMEPSASIALMRSTLPRLQLVAELTPNGPVYDAGRVAAMMAGARSGNEDAIATLKSIAIDCVSRGYALSGAFGAFVADLLKDEIHASKRPGRHPAHFHMRNFHLALCVASVVRDFGFSATRSITTAGKESACSIVASATEELGERYTIKEAAIEKIWATWKEKPIFRELHQKL